MNGQILATFGNLYASAVKNCLFLDYYGVAKAKFGQRNYGGTLNEIVHYNPFSKARVCVCVCGGVKKEVKSYLGIAKPK